MSETMRIMIPQKNLDEALFALGFAQNINLEKLDNLREFLQGVRYGISLAATPSDTPSSA